MKTALLDAARDYVRVAFARRVSPRHQSLFDGPRGERLEHVAPHLFELDPTGMIIHLTVGGLPPGEVGVLVDADVPFADLRRHLRRFLTVVRERDRRFAYFRYYDPRVLRAFLPACTADELRRFFGPVAAFHCQTEDPGYVFTYRLDGDRLKMDVTNLEEFVAARCGVPPAAIAPVIQALGRHATAAH